LHCHRLYYYTAVSDTMAILNASVNFIIYTVTSRKFRRGLISSCHQLPYETAGGGAARRRCLTAPLSGGMGAELIVDDGGSTPMGRRNEPARSEELMSVGDGNNMVINNKPERINTSFCRFLQFPPHSESVGTVLSSVSGQ